MSTSTVTEGDVLRAALERFGRHGGFSELTYFGGASHPGSEVGATCAVGGVEQAIWQLTGRTIEWTVRREAAKFDRPPDSRFAHHLLYGRVMLRLNRLARELYPYARADNVEQLTLTCETHVTARRRVLRVFRAALDEVS